MYLLNNKSALSEIIFLDFIWVVTVRLIETIFLAAQKTFDKVHHVKRFKSHDLEVTWCGSIQVLQNFCPIARAEYMLYTLQLHRGGDCFLEWISLAFQG